MGIYRKDGCKAISWLSEVNFMLWDKIVFAWTSVCGLVTSAWAYIKPTSLQLLFIIVLVAASVWAEESDDDPDDFDSLGW